MDELISIIIPVFRVKNYIDRCVQSVIKQSYSNIEIILVDDGSDDDSSRLCDQYAFEDNRITVIHKKNGGLSSARNVGIELSCGKYLSFVDSDDFISALFIEYLFRAIIETGSPIAQCQYFEFSNISEIRFDNYYAEPQRYIKKDRMGLFLSSTLGICSTVAWNKLYSAELFKDYEIRYPDNKLHEDEFTTHKLFNKSTSIAHLELSLYGYYVNSSGITKSRISSNRLDAIEAKLSRYVFYNEKGYGGFLGVLANQCFGTILNLAFCTSGAIDRNQYVVRINELIRLAKETISPAHLNRHERVLLSLSNSYEQLLFNYRVYTFLGKLSNQFQLRKFKNKINAIQLQRSNAKKISDLFANYQPEKTVFIIGSIEYDNLGDHAIMHAQKDFIKSCCPNCSVIEISDSLYRVNRDKLKSFIKKESLITIPGGGNMGDTWFDDEQRRRWIIQDYPENKIIVFPQTISYTDTEIGDIEKRNSVKIYNQHNNLILCAREKNSFVVMKELYPNCKILLLPDIVLSQKMNCNKDRKGVLLCFRSDVERKMSIKEIHQIETIFEKNKISYDFIDTIADKNVGINDREEYITAVLSRISGAELVITDRLHGMIFCAITKTPCIVFPNSNRKTINVYNTWLKDYSWIKCIESKNLKDYEMAIKSFFPPISNVEETNFNKSISFDFSALSNELIRFV